MTLPTAESCVDGCARGRRYIGDDDRSSAAEDLKKVSATGNQPLPTETLLMAAEYRFRSLGPVRLPRD